MCTVKKRDFLSDFESLSFKERGVRPDRESDKMDWEYYIEHALCSSRFGLWVDKHLRGFKNLSFSLFFSEMDLLQITHTPS
jgi:hypothetical protein